MRKKPPILALVIPFSCLLAVALFVLLTPRENLVWWFTQLKADIAYALNPPEQAVFIPGGQVTSLAIPTLDLNSTLTPTRPVLPVTSGPTATFTPIPTATLTPTPLPPEVLLKGILHMYQMMNNCGPANLAMALTFWGWKGDQRQPAAFMKPNKQDKNVMPYEMEAFVEQETDLEVVIRVGGDIQMLKAFLAAGFPVIAEKGYEGPTFQGWMGHYQVVNGYDEAKQSLIVQDSYSGANLPVAFEDFTRDWRAFNYTYLVIYPSERKGEVVNILGLQDFDNFNYRHALQVAQEEAAVLTGRDLYFALFNQGTNFVNLNDYASASLAYDAAFANYAQLPEGERPWRMTWYQTGPYFAYYFTGRYQDVINLATTTLEGMSEPLLEESFYWRGRARLAQGDREGAIEDYQQCLVAHPDFTPCSDELRILGVEP